MASLLDNINTTNTLMNQAFDSVLQKGGIIPESRTMTSLVNAILTIEGGSMSLDTLNEYFDDVFNDKTDDKYLSMIRIKSNDVPVFNIPPVVYSYDNTTGYINVLYKNADPTTIHAKNIFNNYNNITEIELSPEIKIIGSNSFMGINSGTNIKATGNINTIEDYAFAGSHIQFSLNDPGFSSVSYIGASAFENAIFENSTVFASQDNLINYIDDYAFSEARNYTINIGNISHIGRNAFANSEGYVNNIIFNNNIQYTNADFNEFLGGITNFTYGPNEGIYGLNRLRFNQNTEYPISIFGSLDIDDRLPESLTHLSNISSDFSLFNLLNALNNMVIDMTTIFGDLYKKGFDDEHILSIANFFGFINLLPVISSEQKATLLLNSYMGVVSVDLSAPETILQLFSILKEKNWNIDIPEIASIAGLFIGLITNTDKIYNRLLQVPYNTIKLLYDGHKNKYDFGVEELNNNDRKSIVVNLNRNISTFDKITLNISLLSGESTDVIILKPGTASFNSYIRTNVYDYVPAKKVASINTIGNIPVDISVFYAKDCSIVIEYDPYTISHIRVFFNTDDSRLGSDPALLDIDIKNIPEDNITNYLSYLKIDDVKRINCNDFYNVYVGGAYNSTYSSDKYKKEIGYPANIAYTYNAELFENMYKALSPTQMLPITSNRAVSENSHLFAYKQDMLEDLLYWFNNMDVIDTLGGGNSIELFNTNNFILSYKQAICSNKDINDIMFKHLNDILSDIFTSTEPIEDISQYYKYQAEQFYDKVYAEVNDMCKNKYGRSFSSVGEFTKYMDQENNLTDLFGCTSFTEIVEYMMPMFNINMKEPIADYTVLHSISDVLSYFDRIPPYMFIAKDDKSIRICIDSHDENPTDDIIISNTTYRKEIVSDNMSLIIMAPILNNYNGGYGRSGVTIEMTNTRRTEILKIIFE